MEARDITESFREDPCAEPLKGVRYAASYDYTCFAPHVLGDNGKCFGGRNHRFGEGYRKHTLRDCFL
jgi:hypothetical protein